MLLERFWDPLGNHVGAHSSFWAPVRPSARANTRLTFMIDSIFNYLGYFLTCSHSRTKSPFFARMAISFESESKIQLFTLKGVLDAWTAPRRLQGGSKTDFGCSCIDFCVVLKRNWHKNVVNMCSKSVRWRSS